MLDKRGLNDEQNQTPTLRTKERGKVELGNSVELDENRAKGEN